MDSFTQMVGPSLLNTKYLSKLLAQLKPYEKTAASLPYFQVNNAVFCSSFYRQINSPTLFKSTSSY
jgi:hypothetical protein